VRELKSSVETAVALSNANLLTPEDFSHLVERTPGSEFSAERAPPSAEGNPNSALIVWERLKNIKGEQRRDLLLAHIKERQSAIGRRPTSAEMAEDLGTSQDNVRRILSEAGIRLRDLDES
jgi:DNA-binding NtrC family response regulator